jgi:hypothetical protein
MANPTNLSKSQASTLAIIKACGPAGRDYLPRERGYNLGSVDALARMGLVIVTKGLPGSGVWTVVAAG